MPDTNPPEVLERAVDIPGGTATFRGTKQLRGRDRMLIRAAAMSASSALSKMPPEMDEPRPEGETDEQAVERLSPLMEGVNFTVGESMSLLELRQATVVATLASWTLDLPLPTMDTIGDLDADLYDALDEAIGGVTTAIANAKDFSPTNIKDSDFGASRSLGSPSTDEAENPSIPSLPSDGSPSSGEPDSPEQ